MLSRFRRPRADLQVELDKVSATPGEEVAARITLSPDADFEIRGGSVALVCVETYVQKISNQYGTSYHRKTNFLSRQEESFSGSGVIRKGTQYSTQVAFTMPDDALPTMRGAVVQKIEPGISWQVSASMDVAKARDLSASREIEVPAQPAFGKLSAGASATSPRPSVAEVQHNQCALTLRLDSAQARSGDTLAGSFSARMIRDVSVQEIRVDLVRVEKFGNEEKEHTTDSVTLSQAATLTPDAPPRRKLGAADNKRQKALEWDFQLSVGRVELPSLKTEKSSVRWLVKGVLSRPMRTDLRVEQEVAVDI